jgi:hypothetical protein
VDEEKKDETRSESCLGRENALSIRLSLVVGTTFRKGSKNFNSDCWMRVNVLLIEIQFQIPHNPIAASDTAPFQKVG